MQKYLIIGGVVLAGMLIGVAIAGYKDVRTPAVA
jgi:hypothetical protein